MFITYSRVHIYKIRVPGSKSIEEIQLDRKWVRTRCVVFSDATAQPGPLTAPPRSLGGSFGDGPWAELIAYG